MTIAGKVAITPKGEWNADTTYEKLDLVFYENASYVATKPSTGVLPTDESYWMLVVQSAGGADLDGIIDGTIQVGNAKTLDGNGVEHFASTETLRGSILEKALTLESGVYNYQFSNNVVTSDFPNVSYVWGSATVFVRNKAAAVTVILWGVKTSAINCQPTWKYYDGVGWSDWNTLFTTDGGTLYGNLSIRSDDTSAVQMNFMNSVRRVSHNINSSGRYWMYDHTNDKSVFDFYADGTNTFNGTASGITGGILKQALTITDTGGTTLLLVGTDNDNIYSQYRGKSGVLGYLGFAGKDNLILIGSDGSTLRKILHTGNKPTGTYTGNGDATERTINIGGIGEYVAIRKQSSKGVVIVSRGGYFGTDGTSFITGTDVVVDASGNLIVATINAVFNENGKTYEYAKL